MSHPITPGPFHVSCRDLHHTGDRDWYSLKFAEVGSTEPGVYNTLLQAQEAARKFLNSKGVAAQGVVCRIQDDDESLPNYGHICYVYPRNEIFSYTREREDKKKKDRSMEGAENNA